MMGRSLSHQDIFDAIDRRCNAERERIEAERDLARALVSTWLASHQSETMAGAVEIATTPATARQRKLWTVSEVAEYLRVEPRTVYVWVRERGLLASKAGDELRFDPDEVDRWTMRDRETEKTIEKTSIRMLK